MIFAHFSEPPEDQPEQPEQEQAEPEQEQPDPAAAFPERYKTGLPRRPTLDESFEREPHQGAWPGHLNGTST